MPAEWQIRGYRVDFAKLAAVVGCGDDKLAAQIIKTAQAAGFEDDSRITKKTSVEDAVHALIAGKLDAAHRTPYRILLESVADVVALRLTPKVGSDRFDALTTYAARDELGAILGKLDMKTLGKHWDSAALAWPWSRKQADGVGWPSASAWTAAEVDACVRELGKRKPVALAAQAPALSEDEFFAEDNAGAIAFIAQLPALARAAVKAKRRCVSGASDGLLVLLDGEQ